ncbi:MAG: hypothetical protein QOE63_321, partial [Acidimicrobiaceae bacterium]
MRGRKLTLLALAVAMALVAACGSSSKNNAGSASSSSSNGSSSSSDSGKIKVSEQKLSKAKSSEHADDDFIKRSIDDVQTFWTEEMPKVYGKDYKKIAGGEYPYGPDNPPPSCEDPSTKANYSDVAENAFYCPNGDFVAWDDVNLTNKLLDEFGPYTLAIVVAHELGHGIQQRAGVFDQNLITFVTEQQADCFAGAYTGWVAKGNSSLFELKLSDLDQALGGFLQIRDPVGTDTVNDSSAHGSAFQRINAFEDGLQGGATTCKAYPDGAFNFVPEVFTDQTDLNNGGNLALADVLTLVPANLDAFWTKAFADIQQSWTTATVNEFDPDTDTVKCGSDSATGDDAIGVSFYCAGDDSINFDATYLMPYALTNIGDLADGVLIGDLYSTRAQTLAGLPTDSLDASLQTDCFTGVWVGTLATGELSKVLTLSPGDLDEAVGAFLQFSASADDIESGNSTSGSAFQRLDAFRAGFFASFNGGYSQGLNLCVGGGGATAANSDSN